MPRLEISKTSLAGVATLLILISGLLAWLIGKASAGEAALAMVGFAGAAAALGLIAAKDEQAPDITATTEIFNTKRGALVEIKTKTPPPPKEETDDDDAS